LPSRRLGLLGVDAWPTRYPRHRYFASTVLRQQRKVFTFRKISSQDSMIVLDLVWVMR